MDATLQRVEIDIDNAINKAVEKLRDLAPKDTRNLADNAIKKEKIGEGKYRIYVDEEVAPYMKYTEENWNNFDPPLQGKQNPNEGWFDRAIKYIFSLIASELSATYDVTSRTGADYEQ